jgi:hypothetical protein
LFQHFECPVFVNGCLQDACSHFGHSSLSFLAIHCHNLKKTWEATFALFANTALLRHHYASQAQWSYNDIEQEEFLCLIG